MKIKNRIRQDISQVFNVLIPQGRWNEYVELLDRDGHPNRRELVSLILVFAKHIEVLENLIETEETLGFKLRTLTTVQSEMDKEMSDETEAFFVSGDDFKLLEQAVNPNLAKSKPEYGYGKELNPRSNTEETCLYYKNKPVFRTGL